MKLLCINAKLIIRTQNEKTYRHNATQLIEGKIYETFGKPYYNDINNYVYYINGLGEKMACRFTEVLESSFISKKSLEEIELN